MLEGWVVGRRCHLPTGAAPSRLLLLLLTCNLHLLCAAQFQAALERVRAGADVMPRRQLEAVLVAQLGDDWQTKLAEFDFTPLAAASIGQARAQGWLGRGIG